MQERLDQEKAKKEAARQEAAEKAKAEGKDKADKDRVTENGSAGKDRTERPREGRDADRSLRDRERDRDRPAGRSDRSATCTVTPRTCHSLAKNSSKHNGLLHSITEPEIGCIRMLQLTSCSLNSILTECMRLPG